VPSDVVRLPSGKVMPFTRAMALGFLNPDGSLVDNVPTDSQAAKIIARDEKRAEWTKSQRIEEERAAIAATLTRGQKAAATRAANRAAKAVGGEPDIDVEVVVPKVLRPGNVDHSGNPVTDPETLDRIAAETAALEAAKAVES
jgi:hypothetical protein